MTLAYKFPTISGTASDRTGGTWTNLLVGWIFIETDTGLIYFWSGSAWTIITEKSITETLAGKTLTTPVLNTPTVNGMIGADLAKTSNYTLTATDYIIRADTSGGAFTLTLPTAVGAKAIYVIIRTDILSNSNPLTIATTSSQTIGGCASWILRSAEYLIVESDNANWQVKGYPNSSVSGYYYNKNSTNNRRYHGGLSYCGAVAITTSTAGPALNTLWALPFNVSRVTKFDLESFWVTTVSTAGGTGRVGIYRDDGNCYPGALYYDSGSIATDGSTGIKDSTITSGLQVFQPGLYWLAYEFGTATCQCRVLNSAAGLFYVLGTDPTFPTASNSGFGYSVAHTFGALPDPYTGSATILTATPSATVPIVAVGLRPI